MAGYSTKPLAFKFTVPKGAEKNRNEQEETSDIVDKSGDRSMSPKMGSGSDEPKTDDSEESSESELGTELGAAIKSGNGQAIYEAAVKIFSRCKG